LPTVLYGSWSYLGNSTSTAAWDYRAEYGKDAEDLVWARGLSKNKIPTGLSEEWMPRVFLA